MTDEQHDQADGQVHHLPQDVVPRSWMDRPLVKFSPSRRRPVSAWCADLGDRLAATVRLLGVVSDDELHVVEDAVADLEAVVRAAVERSDRHLQAKER